MPAILEGEVKVQVRNNISTIEFSHPMSNALPSEVLEKLAQKINQESANEKSRVIVLKSSGERAFCAGASFDELISIKSAEQGAAFFSGFAGVINAIRKANKFVIGRVQGKAVGGGVGIASAVDYCLATKYAAVKLSELAIGIGPFVVGPAVERKIGLSAFSSLSINATEFKSAQWAKDKGLYVDLFEDAVQLDHAVDELAEKLAQFNPEAMKRLKRVYWKGTQDWDELLMQRAKDSGELVLSKFTKEAISAFKAKLNKG